MTKHVAARIFMILFSGFFSFLLGAQGNQDSQDPKQKDIEKAVKEKQEDFFLIDVRTPDEYTSGHIPGAVNIPVDVIALKVPTDNKDAKIIVYCRSGARSGRAQSVLQSLGYKSVENFGGVGNWKGALVTGTNPE